MHESTDRSELPASKKRFAELRVLTSSTAGRVLVYAVAAVAALTIVGAAALWPGGGNTLEQDEQSKTVPATVLEVRVEDCPGETGQQCRAIDIEAGEDTASIVLGPVENAPDLSAGEEIRVYETGSQAAGEFEATFGAYTYADRDRRSSLLWLAAAFALLALFALKWRGVLALAGVGLSLLILTEFLIPAILDGKPIVPVAVVASLLVMFVTVLLTNGLGAQSFAALLGITITLVLATLLAVFAIDLAKLDGNTSDVTNLLAQQASGISLEAVVIAGAVIGALGVLADTAVTQASAVMALRRANPELSDRQLYRHAVVVGRDHLNATIHTLVLAYAGAALPLLLAINAVGLGFSDTVNSQEVAEPIVATLVGCAALIAAIPLSTSLAALLVARIPADELPEAHAHAH